MSNPATLKLAAAAAGSDAPMPPRLYFTEEEYREAHLFATISGLYPSCAGVRPKSTGRAASQEIIAGTYKHQAEVDALLTELGLNREHIRGKSLWYFLAGAPGDLARAPLCDLHAMTSRILFCFAGVSSRLGIPLPASG